MMDSLLFKITFLGVLVGIFCEPQQLWIESMEIRTADVAGAGMDNIIGGIDVQIINMNFEICEVIAKNLHEF